MFLYFRKNLLITFILGLLSGLPLALTGSTLTVFVAEAGVDIKVIGLFALIGLPYAFKFVWAPLLDKIYIPFFTKKYGYRKGALFILNAILALSILELGSIDPSEAIVITAVLAFVVALFSASQDIIIDAMRIELLSPTEQAGGATMIVCGYRVGMIISSAGALYIAYFASWSMAYFIIGMFSLSLMFLIITIYPNHNTRIAKARVGWMVWITESFISPFKELSARKNFAYIILFVIFYKLSDAYAQSLISVFLLENGYTKVDIANVVKTFGLAATFFGLFVGGYIAEKISLKNYLLCGLALQMLSNLAYILLINFQGSLPMLFLVISIENICGGISTAALVAYISLLCNKSFTASQYAFFSALSSFGRTWLSSGAGFLVVYTGWSLFFIISAAISLPAIMIINRIVKK